MLFTPFQVALYAHPGRILKMDIEQQALTLVIHEALAWKDESLQWTEDRDLPIEELLLNASDIWLVQPEICKVTLNLTVSLEITAF